LHAGGALANLVLVPFKQLSSPWPTAHDEAAILLRSAAEIVLLGRDTRCFAHRASCARLILRRAAADIVRNEPFELIEPTPLPNEDSFRVVPATQEEPADRL